MKKRYRHNDFQLYTFDADPIECYQDQSSWRPLALLALLLITLIAATVVWYMQSQAPQPQPQPIILGKGTCL